MATARRVAGFLGCCRLQNWLRLLLVVALSVIGRSDGFSLFGYVPDFRFPGVDWNGAVRHTTHLNLFSVEPTGDGELSGLDRFWMLQQSGSPFNTAMKRAGSEAPKVLLTVGGQGRSTHFPAVVADKKLRRHLARRIGQLLVDFPILSGIDLMWETPETTEQWRDLGKLAHELRALDSMQGKLLTMSYHPSTVKLFGSLKSKSSGQRFVDHFDFCHALAYSFYDEHKRHSTQRSAKLAIEEWAHFDLPTSRLTLGMPFFAISRTDGHAKTWSELVDADPSLAQRIDVDETEEGMYFNNGQTLAKKVRFANKRKLGGVMIWELGQDKGIGKNSKSSLLRHVWESYLAETGRQPNASDSEGMFGSFWSDIASLLMITEDNIVCGIAGMVGAYMMLKSCWFYTPVNQRAPRGENDPPAKASDEHERIVQEEDAKWDRIPDEVPEEKPAAEKPNAAMPEADHSEAAEKAE